MDKKITELMDAYDGDIPLTEQEGLFSPERITKLTMKQVHDSTPTRRVRRVSRTLLVAAVAVCLLAVTALAAGLGIHRQRQSELREQLQVDENNVSSYTEYDIPETDDSALHATLLSALRNTEGVQIYINISPVDAALIDAITDESYGRTSFFYSLDGGTSWGPTFPAVVDLPNGSTWAEAMRLAWDEENETLGLSMLLFQGGDEPMDVLIGMDGNGLDQGLTQEGDFYILNRLHLDALAMEERTCLFAEPVAFENTEIGGAGRVLGVTITPNSLTWILEHDDSDELYYYVRGLTFEELSEEEQARVRELNGPWARAICTITDNAVLHFRDGHSLKVAAAESGSYENGVVYRFATWMFGSVIDVEQAESIEFLGVTVPLS